MRLRAFSGWLGCGFLLFASLEPAVANAQASHTQQRVEGDVESARRHFKAGLDYYQEGDLNAAVVEFKRAYAAAPNYRLLYNLGQCCRELRRYTEAEQYLERYLDEGGSDVAPERKAEVESELAKIRMHIGQVILSASVPNAEFFVDGDSIGKGPLKDPVRVSAGTRRISAAAPGTERITRMVEVIGEEMTRVEIVLPPIPVVSAPK